MSVWNTFCSEKEKSRSVMSTMVSCTFQQQSIHGSQVFTGIPSREAWIDSWSYAFSPHGLTLGLLRVQEPIYQLVNYRYTSVVVAIPYGRTKRRSCWCSIFCEDSLLSALLSIAVFFCLCFLNPLYSEVWHGMSEIGLWYSYAVCPFFH